MGAENTEISLSILHVMLVLFTGIQWPRRLCFRFCETVGCPQGEWIPVMGTGMTLLWEGFGVPYSF